MTPAEIIAKNNVAEATVNNLNEIVKSMAVSYVTIMVALLEAKVITAEQLAASLAKATSEVERAVAKQDLDIKVDQ